MFEECPLPQSPRHPTVRVETWLSRMCCLGIPKWPMPFWLKSKALTWATPERASSIQRSSPQAYARRRSGRRTIAVVLPGASSKTHLSWSRWWHLTARAILIAHQKRYWGLLGNYLKEVVGVRNAHLARVRLAFGRGKADCCDSWVTGKAPLHSTLWQNQQIYTLQQEGDVERKDLRPCYLQHQGRCRDSRESVILRANTPMTLPEKKKRRGRDQNPLLQCLPRAAYLMSTMLWWGSQEWEPRKLKGLRRI